MEYSILIKKLREKLMLSQMEMAQLLDVSFASINRWENGKTTPVFIARRKIMELCKNSNVEVGEEGND